MGLGDQPRPGQLGRRSRSTAFTPSGCDAAWQITQIDARPLLATPSPRAGAAGRAPRAWGVGFRRAWASSATPTAPHRAVCGVPPEAAPAQVACRWGATLPPSRWATRRVPRAQRVRPGGWNNNGQLGTGPDRDRRVRWRRPGNCRRSSGATPGRALAIAPSGLLRHNTFPFADA